MIIRLNSGDTEKLAMHIYESINFVQHGVQFILARCTFITIAMAAAKFIDAIVGDTLKQFYNWTLLTLFLRYATYIHFSGLSCSRHIHPIRVTRERLICFTLFFFKVRLLYWLVDVIL